MRLSQESRESDPENDREDMQDLWEGAKDKSLGILFLWMCGGRET